MAARQAPDGGLALGGGERRLEVVLSMYQARDDAASARRVRIVDEPARAEDGILELSSVERVLFKICLLYTSPSPRDRQKSRMPSSA